LAQT